MTASNITQLLQSAPATALPGTWKLARGRAITLRPTSHGILRIAHGRVWATLDGPHGRTPTDSGDHVLEVGKAMFVRPGQRVVIEAWKAAGTAYFSWDPVAAPQAVAVPRRRVNPALVLQPLADLRAAVALGVHAIARLAAGVGALALDLLPATRSSRAALPGCRPHGAMG